MIGHDIMNHQILETLSLYFCICICVIGYHLWFWKRPKVLVLVLVLVLVREIIHVHHVTQECHIWYIIELPAFKKYSTLHLCICVFAYLCNFPFDTWKRISLTPMLFKNIAHDGSFKYLEFVFVYVCICVCMCHCLCHLGGSVDCGGHEVWIFGLYGRTDGRM